VVVPALVGTQRAQRGGAGRGSRGCRGAVSKKNLRRWNRAREARSKVVMAEEDGAVAEENFKDTIQKVSDLNPSLRDA
jgi:hypothetical protein